MKQIFDYFEETIEFPKDIAHDPIPYNVLWKYISSTFLNGFINYVKPIKIYLLDRYTEDDQLVLNEFTKKQLKNKYLLEGLKLPHTNLSVFDDDMIIIGDLEIDNEYKNNLIFFYFDMDVSDCLIGKFHTNDSKEEVFDSVINWLEESKLENKNNEIINGLDNGIFDYIEIPLSFINGWVKF